MDSAFMTGGHILIWPGWYWMFIKHHSYGYRSRFREVLFPATLDNGEHFPMLLGGVTGLVPLKDALSQIDITQLYSTSL